MDKKILDAIKNMDLNKLAKELTEELEKEKAEQEVYLKSFQFQSDLLKLKERVKSGPVADNPYQEPLFNDVSNQSFLKLFDAVMAFSQITKDLSNDFDTESAEYEGMIFSRIYGQGTMSSVKLKSP